MRWLNRKRVFEILNPEQGSDRASRTCDQGLMALIILNVAAAIAESVPSLAHRWTTQFSAFEGFSVLVFTVEYVLRVATAIEHSNPRFRHPILGRLRFMVSPIAIADLLAFLPFFLGSFLSIDLRMLRVLRLIRIFKLAHYFSSLDILLDVLRMERQALGAASFIVMLCLLMAGSGAYVFEHQAQPEAFGSIPASLWWAMGTLTTVGYGDVTPVTLGGKVFGMFVMMIGVGVVAVPTGILATGFALELRKRRDLYSQQLQIAREDGLIDDAERAHLEQVRLSLDLTEETVSDLESTPATPMAECPHCGELLAEPVKPPA